MEMFISGYGVGSIGGNNTSTTEENGFILKYKNKYGEKCKTDDWHIKLNEEEQMVISYDNEDQMNAELLLDKHHNMHITTPTYQADEVKLIGWYSNSHIDKSGHEYHGTISEGDNSTTTRSYINIENNRCLDLGDSGILDVLDKTQFSFSCNYNIQTFNSSSNSLGIVFMRLTYGSKGSGDMGLSIDGLYNRDEDSLYVDVSFKYGKDVLRSSDSWQYRQTYFRYDNITSNLKLKGNKWFNLTCVFNIYEIELNKKVKLYIDGEKINHIDNWREKGYYKDIDKPSINSKIYIAKSIETFKKEATFLGFGQGMYRSNLWNNGINMKISNVMIFNKLLDEETIKDIYKSSRLKYWLTPYGFGNKAEHASVNPNLQTGSFMDLMIME